MQLTNHKQTKIYFSTLINASDKTDRVISVVGSDAVFIKRIINFFRKFLISKNKNRITVMRSANKTLLFFGTSFLKKNLLKILHQLVLRCDCHPP